MKKEKNFKISVVIPIYNVESFLRETVDSVIAQDIGFQENIQIILVNDGSPDNSEEICLDYERQYPDNIIYVKQENAGVSAARNNGKSYVKGKYVNFLDSDDKWSPDAFSEVYRFFEEHYDEVDLVSCKQEFFEAAAGLHPLSLKKYRQGDRIIHIFSCFDNLQMHITASFIKAEVLDDFEFDTKLRYGEDGLFVNEIILRRGQYGVVSAPTHYYRKRANGSSAIQKKATDLDYYFVTPERFYQRLVSLSRERYGYVIEYIQYLLMYDMQWRLKDDIEQFLNEEQVQKYKEILRELLLVCDDDIISEPKNIYVQQKLYLYPLKYGRDIRQELKYINYKLFFNNIVIYKFQETAMFLVDILKVKDDELYLSGRLLSPFSDQLKLWFTDESGHEYPLVMTPLSYREEKILSEVVVHPYAYEIRLPLKEHRKFQIEGTYAGRYPFSPKLSWKKFAKLSSTLRKSYYVEKGYMFTHKKSEIYVYDYSKEKYWMLEKELRREIRSIIENPDFSENTRKRCKEGLNLRKLYHQLIKFKRKEIWLITDRINLAGDNGEAFFKYMTRQKHKDIDVYFVISSKSKDYKRMKQIGKVLPYKSFKHKLYTLMADYIISSQGEDNIVNPFYAVKNLVGDLFHYKYVFLQHGIILNNLSEWLHKLNKNLDMFVTSAYPEYRSILEYDYGYNEDVVKLTGLPRYDHLIQEKPSKKSVLILPTWRANLALEMDPDTGVRPYNTEFKKSEYFKIYQNLISDNRLTEALRKHGYTGKFCVHTNLLPNVGDFTGNDVIEVYADALDYQKEFKENALLVTDYSSVAFDFAYLKKPVIYTQSDRDIFYSGQVYDEGYWDYEQMGFGPVCEDHDSTVDAIISAIEKQCALEEKYRERIEDFYYMFDTDNCKRVYEEIRKLK